jgi:hypothetical protein
LLSSPVVFCLIAGRQYNLLMVDHFVLSHVRRIPLFAYLKPDQLEAVAGAFQQARYAPGEWLYRQGEMSQAMYYFVSGTGQVVTTGADGVARVIGEIQPDDYVGENSLFVTDRRDSSAVTTQDSIVLVLPKAAFDAVLNARPDIRPLLSIRKDLMESVQEQRQHNIRSDEVTLLVTRRHPWAFAGRALAGTFIFSVLIGLAFVAAQFHLHAIVVLVILGLAVLIPLLMGLYAFLEWRNDYFVITNQRIIHEERALLTGAEQREQALMPSIQNVNIARSGPIAEVIGFGDVIVTTMGSQKPLVLSSISDPSRVQQVIFQQMQRHREQELSGTHPPMMNLAPPSSVYAQPGSVERAFRAILPQTRMVEGQRITYRKHWIVLINNLWKPTLTLMILGVLLIIWISGRFQRLQSLPDLLVMGVALIWLMINGFWWYWAYADWHDDLYILDNDWVIDIKRRPLWLNEIRLQAGLQQIQNVTSQIGGFWGPILNMGDVVIQTAAVQGEMVFKGVARPTAVSEEILQRRQSRIDRQTNVQQEGQRQLMAHLMAQYADKPNPQQAYITPTPAPSPMPAPPPRVFTPAPAPIRIEDTQPKRPAITINEDTSTSSQGATPTMPMQPVPPDDNRPEPPDLGFTQASTPPKPPEIPL